MNAKMYYGATKNIFKNKLMWGGGKGVVGTPPRSFFSFSILSSIFHFEVEYCQGATTLHVVKTVPLNTRSELNYDTKM